MPLAAEITKEEHFASEKENESNGFSIRFQNFKRNSGIQFTPNFRQCLTYEDKIETNVPFDEIPREFQFKVEQTARELIIKGRTFYKKTNKQKKSGLIRL